MATEKFTPLAGLSEDQTITRDTAFFKGGAVAQRLALLCTHDIEAVAEAVVAVDDDPAMARCLGGRIKQLNALLMCLFSQDEVLTLAEVSRELYCGSRPLPEGLLA